MFSTTRWNGWTSTGQRESERADAEALLADAEASRADTAEVKVR